MATFTNYLVLYFLIIFLVTALIQHNDWPERFLFHVKKSGHVQTHQSTDDEIVKLEVWLTFGLVT